MKLEKYCTCQVCELMREDTVEGRDMARNKENLTVGGLLFCLGVVIVSLLFIGFLCGFYVGKVNADDSYSAEDYERKQESIRKDEPRIIPDTPVRVERYSPPDYKNDPQVLISGVRSVERIIAKNKISEKAQPVRDSQLTPQIVYVDKPIYVVKEKDEDVIVKTWMEED